MRKLGYIRDLLFTLFIVYYAQGSLYAEGSIIAKAALALILGISGFYFIKTLLSRERKPLFFKAWTALLLLNTIGFILSGGYIYSSQTEMFKSILVTSLSFYPFYYIAQKELLKSKHLLRFFFGMLPITILQYFYHANQILATRMSSSTDVVNNISYAFVSLIPFVFLFKKKILYSFASIMVLMIFIIQSGKRGALIAGVIGLIIYIYFQLRTIERKQSFKNYIIVSIAVLALGYFTYDSFLSNEFLIKRMQSIGLEGGTSGRNIIYANLFNAWYNSNSIFNLLFGYGFAASLNLSGTGNFAHNDWLELLSNFGLVGIIIYGYLFYTTVKNLFNENWNVDKRLLLLAIVLIWFFSTLVSMSYTAQTGYLQTMILAYLIGSKGYSIE